MIKYQNLTTSGVNSFELFLDNIRQQNEFLAYQIINGKNSDAEIRSLLQPTFSLNLDLDTSSAGNWVMLNWESQSQKIIKNPKEEILPSVATNYYSSPLVKNPWKLNFGDLHTIGTENSFIPIAFGIIDDNDHYLGTLSGNLFVNSIYKYIQSNNIFKEVDLIILDKNKRILAHDYETYHYPNDLFVNFENSSKSKNHITFDDKIFVAVKKLNNFPFYVVIGDKKENIISPLKSIFYGYLLLSIIVSIIIYCILEIFYKRIINPITQIVDCTNKIVENKKIKECDIKKLDDGNIKELLHLKSALIQINTLKEELKASNKNLHKVADGLRFSNDKLSKSYKFRSEIDAIIDHNHKDSLKSLIQKVEDILYPELYLKNLKIVGKIQNKNQIIDKNYYDIIKILVGIISRSIFFSSKDSKITIEEDLSSQKQSSDLSLSIIDTGINNEEWRMEQLEEDNKPIFYSLAQNIGGEITVTNYSKGIKYSFLIKEYYNQKSQNNPITNLVHLFPHKK